MSANNKTIEYYQSLPYTYEIIRDNDETNPGWVARVVELPGCFTQGDTFQELGEMLEDAIRGWLEIAIQDGIAIPEPRPSEEYSGKFVVRVPKSLHRELVKQAEQEGVSLNMHVATILARAAGLKPPEKQAPAVEKHSELARKSRVVTGAAYSPAGPPAPTRAVHETNPESKE